MIMKLSFLLAFSVSLVMTHAFRLKDTPMAKRYLEGATDKMMTLEEFQQCIDKGSKSVMASNPDQLIKVCIIEYNSAHGTYQDIVNQGQFGGDEGQAGSQRQTGAGLIPTGPQGQFGGGTGQTGSLSKARDDPFEGVRHE